jgi:hypothetical protein
MDATDTTLFAINKDDTCPATLLPEVDADCICARRAVPAAAAATVVTELLMTPAIAATTLSKDFPSQNRHQTDGKCSEILTSLRELGAANVDKQSDATTRTRVDVEGEEERRGAAIFNIAKKRKKNRN